MIYLSREKGTCDYKVGYTKDLHNLPLRQGAHQTGNPEAIELEDNWDGTWEDEQRLHKVLAAFKKRDGGREWFHLPLGHVLEALMIYAREHELALGQPIRQAIGVDLGDYGAVRIHEGKYRGHKGLYDEDEDEDFAWVVLLETGQKILCPHTWLSRLDRQDP